MKRTQKMQENGQRLQGKPMIGIDPAKNKHQAIVLGPDGCVCGRSFSFRTNHTGFTETLPRRINERSEATAVVFAIEGSCALWQNLAFHLSEQGARKASNLHKAHARKLPDRGVSPHGVLGEQAKMGRRRSLQAPRALSAA